MWTTRNLIKLSKGGSFRSIRKPEKYSIFWNSCSFSQGLYQNSCRNFSSYEERKRESLKQRKAKKDHKILLVYAGAVGLLIASGNIHFIAIPALLGGLHYVKLQGSFGKSLSSIKNRKNNKFQTIFPDLIQLISKHEEAKEYFIEKDSILVENPHFEEFKSKEKILANKYLFECRIIDSATSAVATVQGLIHFDINAKSPSFESLTIHMHAPVTKKLKIIDLLMESKDEEQ
ncbi:unnamed protein product [Moneuplotes crassus]|uniref:Uncharacterized protein n=1 Tax=Euplotes crassus TaxID=5936 RepID=A0AAD2D444_EUPCR|nr:unnamed protein product [Moneuplotes crassus]